MSGPVVRPPDQRPPRDGGSAVVAGAVDVLAAAIWFAVAGLVGAVVWWQATTLPRVTKVGDAATLAPEEVTKQVGIDGWFFVIAAVGGLLSGLVLLMWRRRDPLFMVVLVALGGGLASWLMIRVGLTLGPEPEVVALRGLEEGARVPMQLKLHASGIAWIWSVFAVLGSIVYVWVLRKPDDDEQKPADDE